MELVKPGSKYYPLYKHLQTCRERSVVLTFGEIESLLGVSLPRSATKSKAYWSNRSKGALQAKAWMNAGYHVKSVDFEKQQVIFRKAEISYEVQKEGDTILWNGAMVRALRDYLDLNQADFSRILGVRQQTVSEWENQIYKPTRSRSNHLTMVAERAGYKFQSSREGDTRQGEY
jgi:DNA-binding transcriptional regulator YiaG